MKPHDDLAPSEEGTIVDYVKHRLTVADENLQDAKLLFR